VQVATAIDSGVYTFTAAYDASSRLAQVTSPSGLTVGYGYTALGYARQLTNVGTGQVYWTANALDHEQHITQETAGNGIVTSRTFDITTGRLTSVVAGTGNAVQSMSYVSVRPTRPTAPTGPATSRAKVAH
jgi:YD repeat-containing protein